MFSLNIARQYYVLNMNLQILLYFGIVSTACAIYKIPKYDACTLKVLLCDDFIKPLTPIDNSTLEMFQSIEQLNAICEELSKFRICLKDAEIFCKENAKLDVGFALLDNRRLAFDLCNRSSALQEEYMMVEECVNKYSHSAIEFCTDRAVETVGLDFYLDDFESECKFLGAMQHCHIAIITYQCGGIAGNMLEKLVIYRGQRDYMCINYENERLKNLEAFHATMDSYVQQYRNKISQNKTGDKTERLDKAESLKTPSQEASSKFQSRISPISDTYTSNRQQLLNLEISDRPLCSCPLSGQKIIDSENKSQNIDQHTRRFYEQPSRKFLSDESCACKTKASFLLIGIRPNGEHFPIGYGVANVLWATFSPLKDLSCEWMRNLSSPISLGKCLILIDDSLESSKDYKRKMESDLPFNTKISVYETVGKSGTKLVTELRVHSFLKYSSELKTRLEEVINFFKTHAHDIRFWCSEQYEANLYKEPNHVHSTNRIGIVTYDINKDGIESERRRDFEQKYNFYKPEIEEYPIDTEIHLISSEEGLANGFEIGDNYVHQNYDPTQSPFLSYEMSDESSYDKLSTLRPATPPKQFGLYRPYELYRPRVGEVLEEHGISREYLDIKDTDENEFYSNVLFEDSSNNGFTSLLHAKEMCPVSLDNISKLDNMRDGYSMLNYMHGADPLNLEESKSYKTFPISEAREDMSSFNTNWNAGEPEYTEADNKETQYKEIYIVTPSTVIETSSLPKRKVSEFADIQNMDENSQTINKEDDSQDFVEFSQESTSKDFTLNKDCQKKSNSEMEILELISDHQNDKHTFSDKFTDLSISHEEL